MQIIERSDPLVTICSILLLIGSLIWNIKLNYIYKVEKNGKKSQVTQ